MKIGIFPHADIGSDPAAIRDFAQAVEAEQVPSWISYAAESRGWASSTRRLRTGRQAS